MAPSANSLGFGNKLSERSLISIKKKTGPRIYPSGTLALQLAHEEYGPFKTSLYFVASREIIERYIQSYQNDAPPLALIATTISLVRYLRHIRHLRVPETIKYLQKKLTCQSLCIHANLVFTF